MSHCLGQGKHQVFCVTAIVWCFPLKFSEFQITVLEKSHAGTAIPLYPCLLCGLGQVAFPESLSFLFVKWVITRNP